MPNLTPQYLHLQNGQTFTGLAPSWQNKEYFGEVVFNTGMTGYVESLTDPSYTGQILTFTYPLIGNYGVPEPKFWESNKVRPAGVVISEACLNYSHQNAKISLLTWLKEQKVPIITGIDTRALTKTLRESGVMLGVISYDARPPLNPLLERRGNNASSPFKGRAGSGLAFIDPNINNLAAVASITKPKIYGSGKKTIIAVDCGMKENIIRCLKQYPITIKRVPHNYNYNNERVDGVFISNGPGDPAVCTETIEILKEFMKKKKPVFGICLGSQIMALAAGAKTYKLPFGHRGHNQPCQNILDGKCVITSQNHGYAVIKESLPNNWAVNFVNLNDGSIEGIEHKTLPFFSVQFHPEASPGPTDTNYLFDRFYKLL